MMPWSKLDDGLDEHPKVEVLIEDDELRGLAALGLWALTVTNSSRRLTDGQVATATLRKIAPKHGKALAQRLVDAGLFDADSTGYQVHDFHDYNPTAEEARTRRAEISAKRAEAGRKGGLAKAEAQREQAAGNGPSKTKPKGPAIAESALKQNPSPVPVTTAKDNDNDYPVAKDDTTAISVVRPTSSTFVAKDAA